MFKIRDYSVLLPLKPKELDRLMNRIRIDSNGCWIWTGALDHNGYGPVSLRGRSWRVHRVFFVLFHGHVSTDKVVHHKCGNRACCNPEHLEATDNYDNIRKAKRCTGKNHYKGRRTHCSHGHLLTEDNVVYRNECGRTYRVCRICLARWRADRRVKLRDAARSRTGPTDPVRASPEPSVLMSAAEPSDWVI